MKILIKDDNFKQKGFDFEISYISEQGGRPVNEDSVVVEAAGENVLLSVADGLGAHGGGDIASKIASDISTEEYLKLTGVRFKDIFTIFRKIDDAVVEAQTDEVKMKTTMAGVLLRKARLYGAHLGDTRIYIFRKSKATYMTEDHSVAYDEVMRNHGTLDDIRKNPNRHILSAALGVGNMRPPDVFKQKIRDNSAVLICSDGFWEYVNEDEMLDMLNKTATAHDWLEAMLKRHSEKAVALNDNYSAICLRITKN